MEYISFAASLVGLLYNNITQLDKDTLSESVKETLTSVKGDLTQPVKGILTSVKDKFELINRLEGNVKNLSNKLRQLEASSSQFTQEGDNAHLAGLVDEIKDVVFQAEDAIETYFVKTQRHRLRESSDKAFNAIDHILKLLRIANNIENITKKVSDLHQTNIKHGPESKELDKTATAGESKKGTKFIEIDVRESGNESMKPGETAKLEKNATANQSKKKKRTSSPDDGVVGFKDEEKEIIELLTQGPKNREVISIFGMLGLGKTTLARMVFNHPTVEYQFFVRAFVQVSQDYSVTEIFQKILKAFTTENLSEKSDEELADMISEYLDKRQYLIVLDDVWSIKAWNEIENAFPDNEKRSRILITTRIEDVALKAYPKRNPHYLRFLNEKERVELLRKKVFGENICPPRFQKYEKEILKRSQGLPLAIVVVAGILISNRDKEFHWRDVLKGVATYNPELKEENDKVIGMSYNHLPPHLKPCFLYLGVFREDSEIPARTLLLLWVSEGFIEANENRPFEDTARQYLEELVGRSLVMVGNRRPDGQIKTCRIHDTLREFCKEQAKKEILFREIKRYEQEIKLPASSSTSKDRRLFCNSHVKHYIELLRPSGEQCKLLKPSCERVRSFLSFAKEDVTLDLEDIPSIPNAFGLLRVLEIRPVNLIRFPDLPSLFLLKYIALSGDLKILPQKMSDLCNLQTLVVRTSSQTLEIKWDIGKMPQFRHLDTNSCTSLSVKSSSINANLQTLSTISPESCKKEVFARTPSLKKLGIKGELAKYFNVEGQCSLFTSFQELQLLENLKLVNEDSKELKALPDHKKFPGNLTRLTLCNALLDWKHMWTLGKLEKLEELKLEDNAFTGESWNGETEDRNASPSSFVSLEVLRIGKTDLVGWEALASNFPALTHLYLKYCDKLASIPANFVHIPCLQMIDLYCTNKNVALSANNIQVAKLKMQAKDRSDRTTPFKLSVYPPDDIPSETSSTTDLSTGKAS